MCCIRADILISSGRIPTFRVEIAACSKEAVFSFDTIPPPAHYTQAALNREEVCHSAFFGLVVLIAYLNRRQLCCLESSALSSTPCNHP